MSSTNKNTLRSMQTLAQSWMLRIPAGCCEGVQLSAVPGAHHNMFCIMTARWASTGSAYILGTACMLSPSVVLSTCSPNPADRPSLSDLQQHPYLQQYSGSSRSSNDDRWDFLLPLHVNPCPLIRLVLLCDLHHI